MNKRINEDLFRRMQQARTPGMPVLDLCAIADGVARRYEVAQLYGSCDRGQFFGETYLGKFIALNKPGAILFDDSTGSVLHGVIQRETPEMKTDFLFRVRTFLEDPAVSFTIEGNQALYGQRSNARILYSVKQAGHTTGCVWHIDEGRWEILEKFFNKWL